MTNDDKKNAQNTECYYCKICNFTCSKKSNFNKHLLTRKHSKYNEIMTNDDKKNAIKYICECGNIYSYRQGLFIHKKKCFININEKKNIHDNNSDNELIKNINNTKDIINNLDLKNMFIEIINENKELRKIMFDQQKQINDLIPKIGNNNNSNNNTNCNNNTFNLQLFLNETCKDAMNLNQFVDNINITMDDLKNTKNNGLVQGITNIIIRGLKELEVHERPIHCTDLKRDTLYIKANEKWMKDENNEMFKETIEEIIEKEQDALNMWTDAHPDWDKIPHLQDEYVLMVNRMYQPVMQDEKKEKKIIHNISKEVYIQK
jgi:hypothetical protein